LQGAFNVGNLSVQGNGSGTVTIKRDGVDLGKIEQGAYKDYTLCLIEMTKLLSMTIVPRSEPIGRPLSLAEERGLKPKDTFKECSYCPQMLVVPAGGFTMGSRRYTAEGPQHTVTFARPFAVGQFAVTFEEWDACVVDGGCNGYNPSVGAGAAVAGR
jgi:formylglycine-generating enzyme required for sulfatase activity